MTAVVTESMLILLSSLVCEPHYPLSLDSAEAGEAAFWVAGHVLGRRRQQRRLQRLLGALVQFAQRRHGAALPASDGGRGGGAEPLRQRQLVWEEGGTAGTAEPAQEPEDAQVGVARSVCDSTRASCIKEADN